MKTFESDAQMQAVIDAGEESLTEYADLSTLRKPGKKSQRMVNVTMSDEMISELDAQADRACVTRQSLIKLWLRERLDLEAQAGNHVLVKTS